MATHPQATGMSWMEFRNPDTQIYVPDGAAPAIALQRTTHLAVGAHQDDVPIMAFDGILRCFGKTDRWFVAVTVTDGAGSPRTGRYADCSDEQMKVERAREEIRAADIGEYSAAIQLSYTSQTTRDGSSNAVTDDLATVITAASPQVVYTHNPADKHDTHVATALRTIAAIRSVARDQRPRRLYGCEVWRNLDWLVDSDKVLFDFSDTGGLFTKLMGAYESQIAGGKPYDRATAARWLANATFLSSSEIGEADALGFGMDLTPLIEDPGTDVATYISDHIARMRDDIVTRLRRLGK